MKNILFAFLVLSVSVAAQNQQYVVVLGIAQDGGFPHLGCQKQCCSQAWHRHSLKRNVASLALVDEAQKKWWLLEATPDITQQLQLFRTITNDRFKYLPDGIFVTHAHIGHYTGLMYFGREALGAREIPVYVLPRFFEYLQSNGPWSQLVALRNIKLIAIADDVSIALSQTVSVKPFIVPHRGEYSETAGFHIVTSDKRYLFIPDIDKWSKWNRDIVEEVKQVDIAFLDATFYQQDELPERNMAEVPHPFVVETIKLFDESSDKKKIVFIHFNHSNPLMWDAQSQQQIVKLGFGVAVQGRQY